MPYPINQTFRDEKNKEENQPIMLYEIEVDESNVLKYAEYDIEVNYGGNTYIPFPIKHEIISSNLAGEIDAVKVNVTNISREIGALLIQNNGLKGKKVIMKLVFADHLDDPDANISDTFYIDAYELNENAATFLLTSKLDILEVQIPGRIFVRDYCQWQYKKEGCWLWNGSAWEAPTGFTNEATQCDKTLKGSSGCEFHNNKLRFGGFPGIPSRSLFYV